MQTFRIRIQTSFVIPLLPVQLSFGNGVTPAQLIELKDGEFTGELPARPTELRIVPPLYDEGPAGTDSADLKLQCVIPPGVEVELTFQLGISEHGFDISVCAQSARFGGLEHSKSANRIGYVTPYRGKDHDSLVTPIKKLPIGNCHQEYGAIIALAGDHFAYLDQEAAQAPELRGSWPQPWQKKQEGKNRRSLYMTDAAQADLDAILTGGHIDSVVRNEHPLDFLDLAAHNFCHFAQQSGEVRHATELGLDAQRSDPWSCYHYYHNRALDWAQEHRNNEHELLRALGIDAFGAHFLTDLFASGHMRVPRRYLVNSGAVQLWGHLRSMRMHHRDNRVGLWVTTTYPFEPRWVWRAYGDNYLYNSGHDRMQGIRHADVVEESVRRSVKEVMRVWREGATARLRHPLRLESEQVDPDSAEALVPRVLPVGFRTQNGDGITRLNLKWTGNEEPQSAPLYCCPEESA